MFHSWDLWEPAGILLSKIFNELMIDNHDITLELCIAFLKAQQFFDPYYQELLSYEYLMHVTQDTELRLNLDFVNDTIEILTVRTTS